MKVSRREHFSRAYTSFQDEQTPEDLTGYVFRAELWNSRTKLLNLTEGAGISRPDANTVVVSLNTIQMGELNAGDYTMLLFGERLKEQEVFVQLAMQVE